MPPWFSSTSTTAQRNEQSAIKPLTVQESIRHLNPPKPVKNVRFSSLLLEHGELIVQDWAVALSSAPVLKSTRQHVNNNTTKHNKQQQLSRSGSRRKKRNDILQQQRQKSTSLQMMQGRLHLCTQSLVFEPLDVMRPILRFPFGKMPLLPHEVTPSSTTDDNVEESYEIPLIIRFESARHIRIKENNVIGPFEVIDVCEKYTITFLHSSPQTSFCQLCQVSYLFFSLVRLIRNVLQSATPAARLIIMKMTDIIILFHPLLPLCSLRIIFSSHTRNWQTSSQIAVTMKLL